ncbi:hypothetical protein UNSWCS_359 [Campylobacter concisus UNSWCS]|uniref:Uncharacterized protein n=1 Tax=Campylobacter concisus UNSWCS TaxID=1242968 RepID=U2GW81_9BACT|nr:hypothetical protein UNSWCS_359 [Campylobacter concisus UNSWCS]
MAGRYDVTKFHHKFLYHAHLGCSERAKFLLLNFSSTS